MTVGMVGGFIGVGGGYIVTPALIVFGFPGYMASGIDVAHIAGKSIDARDVMGWMTLEAYQGSRIQVKIEYDPKNNEKNSYVDKLTAELVKLIDSDLDEIVERYARTQSNFRIRIIHFLMNYLPHFLRRGK